MKRPTMVAALFGCIGFVGGALAIAATLLAGCLVLLTFVCGPFISQFNIVNNSGAEVSVTPIGMGDRTSEYSFLPTYASALPSIPYVARGFTYDISLEPSESVRIIYDMDDVQFGHILVRSKSGEVFIVVTGEVDGHCCCGPEKETYEIPPLSHLPKAPPELVPCIEGEQVLYFDPALPNHQEARRHDERDRPDP